MAYTLPQLLTESAKRFPEKEALHFNGEGMTYADLEARTNQVANLLAEKGVRKGDRTRQADRHGV